MFISENYANPSLDRRRRLIGMRPDATFFIHGMNGSGVLLQVLLQMFAPTHGPASLAKLFCFNKACCQFACASVGSTFALLASFWCWTRGPAVVCCCLVCCTGCHIKTHIRTRMKMNLPSRTGLRIEVPMPKRQPSPWREQIRKI